MTLSAYVGSFNIDTSKTAGQTQAVTGVGFTPKLVLFWWSGTTRTTDGVGGETINYGFGCLVGSSSRWTNYTRSLDAAATSSTLKGMLDTACIAQVATSTTTEGLADWASFDSDGFTLTIDQQFTNAIRVSFLALGGTDITDIATGSYTQPNVTGDFDVTTVGFQPDFLLLGGYGNTAYDNALLQGNFNIGMATGSGNQGVVANKDRNGQATTSAHNYAYNGEISASLSTTGLPVARDAFVSFLSNGFRLNELEASTMLISYLAIKGGQWLVSELNTRTDGNDIVETVGFQPAGLLFMSGTHPMSAQNTGDANAELSIGAATSTTNRAAQGIWSANNLADSETSTANYDTACYAHVESDTLQALMDIKSIDSNGFTCVMDDVDITAAWVLYLAVGSSAAPSINIPVLYHQLQQQGIGD